MLASTMARQMEKRIHLQRSNVVGVIHTVGGFAEAGNFGLDAVEVRVDALPRPPSLQQVAALLVPAILTVRHVDEGGIKRIGEEARLGHYLALLPAAAAVDIEMRFARRLRDVIEAARHKKRALIVSFHDFEATPSLAKLRRIRARARGVGADIVKIATKIETPAEVARLLVLLEEASEPLAVMGMGSLGRASRLLFAKAGSALNYGWLDKPQVPGQWSAKEFLELLARS
jgi:3-dehydroquinate dehydratase I